MALREEDYGRDISRATTRPFHILWCEKEYAAAVGCMVMLIVCPTGFSIKYVIFGIVAGAIGFAIGQLIYRMDPRAIAKLRAHRRWKAQGSAVLLYFVDERTILDRGLEFLGLRRVALNAVLRFAAMRARWS